GDERVAWAWNPARFRPLESKPPNWEMREVQAKHEEEAVGKPARDRLEVFRAAVRADRQLATALRDQGMNEEADRFAYRAQVIQRQVFHQQASAGALTSRGSSTAWPATATALSAVSIPTSA